MSAIYQHAYGFRHKSDWGEGIFEAPYREGDVVFIPADAPSGERDAPGPGVYRIVSSFSIAEGPEWYFRVSPMTPTGRGDRWRTEDECSGRLHVIPGVADYTAGWVTLHIAGSVQTNGSAREPNRSQRFGDTKK